MPVLFLLLFLNLSFDNLHFFLLLYCLFIQPIEDTFLLASEPAVSALLGL